MVTRTCLKLAITVYIDVQNVRFHDIIIRVTCNNCDNASADFVGRSRLCRPKSEAFSDDRSLGGGYSEGCSDGAAKFAAPTWRGIVVFWPDRILLNCYELLFKSKELILNYALFYSGSRFFPLTFAGKKISIAPLIPTLITILKKNTRNPIKSNVPARAARIM